ncbi:MAG: hypothetical protein BMS9Abin02_1451 [Anaerolineae bacterium]|nr:MAG: hypothetical protein BMS9Abin02_1451 [Anaerolineae bacterium]
MGKMGFPEWTLLGMGLSLLGALVALSLALLGQAPGLLKRTGLVGARLDQNVRAFTSYAFALLLLAVGFFIAGVPLGPGAETSAVSNNANISAQPAGTSSMIEASPSQPPLSSTPIVTSTAATPITGAFGGPPSGGIEKTPTGADLATAATLSGTVTDTDATISSELIPTNTQLPPTPLPEPATTTPTSSPSPTRTPSPTITPTPIVSQTAKIDTAGSTIWLVRSPGGRNLVTITDGEVVIILPRHANQGGILWREVSTGSGIVGWVQEEFLNYFELSD